MRVLFLARHFTYFRNFESVVALLAERGHSVCLVAERDETLGGRALVDRLAGGFPERVEVREAPPRGGDSYRPLATSLRLGLDYLRYTDERYEAVPKIRERAVERTPSLAVAIAQVPVRPVRSLLTRLLHRVEEAVPRPASVDALFDAARPDVLLVTPLIELGSPQIDYLRAARARGIRTALCVWSWDHLSSKALIRVVPDVLLVWNETQRLEAQQFHGIAPDRVVVTGAQCFDQWFARAPSRDRAAFLARVGLPSVRPYLLYVCSALFKNSPSEAAFVREWVEAIRRAPDSRLRDIGILVRPHPQRADEWRSPDPLAGCSNVALWGSNPIDAESRADYFDSMFHAAGVVGLNTSALVEAAIVDRPVFTLLLPEFRDNQEGTFHFHHLLQVGDGFLHTARSLDEHVGQLSSMLAGGTVRTNRPFVEAFIRPRGAGVAATPVFVEAVEALASRPPRPAVASAWTLAMRPVVHALSVSMRTPGLERLFWHQHKRQDWEANVRAIRDKASRRRRKRQDKAWRVVRKAREQAVVRAKTATKQALGK